MFAWIAMGFLAALGLLTLLWFCWGWLLRPIRCDMRVMLDAKGNAAGLEQTVWALRWLGDASPAEVKIRIRDCGLNEKGLEIARHLVRQPGIEWITEEKRGEDLGTAFE